jgi:cystathionine beta-lyase
MNAFEGLDLDVLATRRSHKWRMYPPDVLPAFVAEIVDRMATAVKGR